MVVTQDPVLQRIIQLIVGRIDPRKVILFGSRARGDARPDSDIDLLIIEDSNRPDATRRLGEVYVDMVSLRRPPTDLLLYGEDEFNEWRNSRNHVIGRASREGVVVYERPR